MRVGIDLSKQEVYMELTDGGGLKTTAFMTPELARVVAGQLEASARELEDSTAAGLLRKEDDANA